MQLHLQYSMYLCIRIVARMWRLYKTGIGLTTGFIGSHTVTVYTLYDSQQLSLFSCSEDCCSNSATNSYGVPCHYSLTGAAPLSNTNCSTNYLYSKLYSPWTDPKENTSPIPLLFEWRHYRNGSQRKLWSFPLLRCMATACKQASHCWLLIYSVHVTVWSVPEFDSLLYVFMRRDNSQGYVIVCVVISIKFWQRGKVQFPCA
jgi:hypothetical protein